MTAATPSPADPALRAHWRFDTIQDGRLPDTSGNANNALASGTFALVPDDVFGMCAAFQPGSGYIEMPPQALPEGGEISICLWARGAAALAGDANIFLAKSMYGPASLNILLPRADGTVVFECGNDGRNVDTIAKPAQPNEIRGAWTHWAFTKDARRGEMKIYRNGTLWHSATAKMLPLPRTVSAFLNARASYQGGVANLRIFSRTLSADEVAAQLRGDWAAFAQARLSYPLDTRLYDGNDQPVLYVDDEASGHDLWLEISNASRLALDLGALGSATATDHHFELVFRPGVLAPSSLAQVALATPGWQISPATPQPDGTVSFYLSSQAALTLRPREPLRLQLLHLRADGGGGSRGTTVQLRYEQLRYASDVSLAISGSRVQSLEIVSQRSKRGIPLHAGLVGSSAILNDGRTANSLRLRITNISGDETLALNPAGHPRESRFLISFDVDREWGLSTAGQAQAVAASADGAGWNVAKAPDAPQWVVTSQGAQGLAPGQAIQLSLSAIVSSLPSGPANLYVRYHNIPGYWNGQLVCTVEKSPLLYRADSVGIGTDAPGQRLVVEAAPNSGRAAGNRMQQPGQLALRGPAPQIDFVALNGAQWAIHASDNKLYFIGEPWNTKMLVLDSRGQVGIGTDTPGATLEVGGLLKTSALAVNSRAAFKKIQSGRVRVGATGQAIVALSIAFPEPFTNEPQAVVGTRDIAANAAGNNPLYQPRSNRVYAATVVACSPAAMTVNVALVSGTANLPGELFLDWMAWEL